MSHCVHRSYWYLRPVRIQWVMSLKRKADGWTRRWLYAHPSGSIKNVFYQTIKRIVNIIRYKFYAIICFVKIYFLFWRIVPSSLQLKLAVWLKLEEVLVIKTYVSHICNLKTWQRYVNPACSFIYESRTRCLYLFVALVAIWCSEVKHDSNIHN
jgi:hypothetical protein